MLGFVWLKICLFVIFIFKKICLFYDNILLLNVDLKDFVKMKYINIMKMILVFKSWVVIGILKKCFFN